jgi:hypothetical protein
MSYAPPRRGWKTRSASSALRFWALFIWAFQATLKALGRTEGVRKIAKRFGIDPARYGGSAALSTAYASPPAIKRGD